MGGTHGALSFNGTSDAVVISDVSVWDFGTGDFTMSTWFKTSNINTDQTIMDVGKYGVGVDIIYGSTSDTIDLYVGNDSGNYQHGPFSPVADTWYLLTARRISGVKEVYINGSILRTGYASAANIQTTFGVRLGDSIHIPGTIPLNGSLDDVRIYNRALTSTEILELYNSGSGTEGE
jgi:hypothetical protein